MLQPEIRQKLDGIKVIYRHDHREVKCFCGKTIRTSIVRHLKTDHLQEWRTWGYAFVRLRNEGLSYYSIISKFKTKDQHFLFTSSVVQGEVQRLIEGGEAELALPRKERIDRWQPENLCVGRGTIWDFKNRGDWAVHKGDYRGNWPPEIPRILIDRYSEEQDVILDPFVGGGTTLIEAWLANRRSYGVDINPVAITTSNTRISEMVEHSLEDQRVSFKSELRPVVIEGDARRLSDIMHSYSVNDGSVSLVFMHPPYLDSLKYTASIDSDLSHISDPAEFCDQLQLIARQILSLLSENGKCALLMGDVRKNNQIIPLGFLVMERFLQEGFKLKNIIIKTQSKDSSTRFWYSRKDKLDFLISHEYLFIFGK